jgi:hypothetical protein
VSWGLTQNQKRTKRIYMGPADKPTMQLFFFDDPKQNFSGWSVDTIQYQDNGKTEYVCDLKYLTEKQRRDKNTIIVDFTRLFHRQALCLVLIAPYDYNQETGEVKRFYRVDYFDTNSDGNPDILMFGLVSDPKDTASELFNPDLLTKEKIQTFKLFMKQIINYKNAEKEFQKWLKENKQ